MPALPLGQTDLDAETCRSRRDHRGTATPIGNVTLTRLPQLPSMHHCSSRDPEQIQNRVVAVSFM
ncbi:MAG TPA: hypothetical protein PK156_24265 [Polyangium sp.]|nr:hypothetical protein [Polyangium sp.]